MCERGLMDKDPDTRASFACLVAATVLAERSHVVKLPFGVKVPIKLAPEGVQATVEKAAGGEKKVW